MINNALKEEGKIFTPLHIVNILLDVAKYTNAENILEKHFMDNSAGDGNIVVAAVSRYCVEHIRYNSTKDGLKHALETYIHAIELNKANFRQLKRRLDEAASMYGITDVKWDIRVADSLSVHDYDGKMDYVVGNPPYVRVHNLGKLYKEVKNYKFADKGMCDLYLAFFELGIRMLNDTGKLSYITPSSWMHSTSGTGFRNYLLENGNLSCIIDFGHKQVFKGITTYSMITCIDKNLKDSYVNVANINELDQLLNGRCRRLSLQDMNIEGKFYIGDYSDLKELREIRTGKYEKQVIVKNGFATLNDKVFIDADDLPRMYCIPVLKASTGKWGTCFYPYDATGHAISQEDLLKPHRFGDSMDDSVEAFLIHHKAELLKGRKEKPGLDWTHFGRTQAIGDVYRPKLAVNTVVKDTDSVKANYVESGKGVYSGLYIIGNCRHVAAEKLIALLTERRFIDYVAMLKNYKSGGYYTFSSHDLECYLNYRLSLVKEKRIIYIG